VSRSPFRLIFYTLVITNYLCALKNVDHPSKKFLLIVAPSGTCWPLTELPASELSKLTELASLKDRQEIVSSSTVSVVKVRHTWEQCFGSRSPGSKILYLLGSESGFVITWTVTSRSGSEITWTVGSGSEIIIENQASWKKNAVIKKHFQQNKFHFSTKLNYLWKFWL